MVDLKQHHMIRVVTENCYSDNPFPRTNHHGQNGLIWGKNEIVTLIAYAGGDLYFATPFNANPNDDPQYVMQRCFRELTPEERTALKINPQPGQPVQHPGNNTPVYFTAPKSKV
jgi:hypothetical protein